MLGGTRRRTSIRSASILVLPILLVGLVLLAGACRDMSVNGSPTTETSPAGATPTEVVVGTTVAGAPPTTTGGASSSGTSGTSVGSGATSATVPHVATTRASAATTVATAGYSWHRYEESDPRLGWSGGWGGESLVGASGGSIWMASSEASVKLDFEGKKIRLYGFKGYRYGSADVILDYDEPGERAFVADFYSPTDTGSELVWTSPSLDGGRHRLKIMWTGKKDPAADDAWIDIDAIEVYGNLL